ncbi:MAG TPA: hypothetical protein GX724_01635 [Fibrobacter sp.]|nr:hypothetical protein [Fibrobacter sp.]
MTSIFKTKLTELSNGKMILLVVLIMFVVFMLFVLPIWFQNRYIELSEKEILLSNEIIELKTEISHLRLLNNKLSSLEQLSAFAVVRGLDYNIVPIKLMPVGGN